MSTKILYVSSAVQAALMSQVFIPELIDGFWKNHRPAGHGDAWRDVEVKVSDDGTLGPVGFDAPRNYNFLNLDFALPNEARLVAVAQSAKSNSNFKSVKKELIELGRIVGSRLASRDAQPVKLFRGNHKEGTVTVSSARARQASATMIAAGEIAAAVAPTPKTTKPVVKKTVTKRGGGRMSNVISADLTTKKSEPNVTVTKTAAGATVRRVPVSTAPVVTATAE
jgi:hypothetical protein